MIGCRSAAPPEGRRRCHVPGHGAFAQPTEGAARGLGLRALAFLLIVTTVLGSTGCAPGVGGGTGVSVGPGWGVGVHTGVSTATGGQLRLEWEPDTRGDRVRITGYVYNDYVLAARDIVLVVESLDASGRVVGRTRGYVNRVVTPGSSSYFDVSLPAPAAGYRVDIVAMRWLTDDETLGRLR